MELKVINIKTLTYILAMVVVPAALFAVPPSKEQIAEATKAAKLHLADNLNNPDSYKEGDWTFWIVKLANGEPLLRVLHEYGAANKMGGITREILLGSPNSEKEWDFHNLLNYEIGGLNLGPTIMKNMYKEMATLPKEDVVMVKPKKTLGGVEIKE